MTIKKGTKIGRRNGPPVDGVQLYEFTTYGSNAMFNWIGGGDNKPTLEQLTAKGLLVESPADYNPLTHKLVEPYAESFADDGVYITRKTVALTVDEVEANATNTFLAKVQAIEDGLDRFIDDVAKAKKYGTVHMSPTEACLAYAGYDNPFRAESEAYGAWKAAIWPVVFQIQDDYLDGKRPEPTLEIIISELPPMVWPT